MATTPGDKTAGIKLEPGEVCGANGVIHGAGAHPDIPRYGADEAGREWVQILTRPLGE
jgi:hypothetical protein